MAKLLIFGCGNMGSAVLQGILDKEIFPANQTLILERYPNAYTQAFQERGCRVFAGAAEISDAAEVVILGVKPQDAAAAMEELKPLLAPQALVISIMAGISLAGLEAGLGPVEIIRSMPNTPAQVHLGMSAYLGNDRVSAASYALTERIFSAFGKALRLQQESMIDAATAISGSGPAYLFYLAEAMQEGAVKLGFTAEEARLLANQTLLGAASLLAESKEDAATLRQKVTSKGGTTEAALRTFGEAGVKEGLIQGFVAAFERAQELGKK